MRFYCRSCLAPSDETCRICGCAAEPSAKWRHDKLSALRCAGCKRAPRPEEVKEMIDVFGHKLTNPDEPLVWTCLPCSPS